MKTTLHISPHFVKHAVDEKLFCGFIEHLGRAVYSGIYEPGHPTADADGFRQDVAALVRELGMPLTRYPGGNFVSSFDWKDSIGPVSQRPVRADYNWFALEPNRVGLHEFVKWCRLAGTAPLYTVNLGTGTSKEAMECVEYCNAPTGSYWSDLRRANGSPEPFGIRYWCLGNEMDGKWQIGHKNGREYGRVACEAAKMMKMVDPAIKVVLCGSSNGEMATFGSFDMEALDEAYENVDYISLHVYFGNRDGDMAAFLASPEKADRQIEAVIACCDAIKAKHKSSKRMMLSFDEWNVWYRQGCKRPAPGEPLCEMRESLEELYDMADVLVDGGMLMSLLEHGDRVGIACLAQTVNVIAAIMTRAGGGCWRQSIFYPFAYTSRYGRGEVLAQHAEGGASYAVGDQQVPFLRSIVVHNSEAHELVLFAINRSLDSDMELSLELGDFVAKAVIEAIEIHNDDLSAVNTEDCERVRPEKIAQERIALDGRALSVMLKPASWNMVRIAL